MRKLLLVSIILFASLPKSEACDICGSGVSNYNPYLFPHLSRAYLGASYYYRQYHTTSNGTSNKEIYNTLLVTGQLSIGKRIQLIGMIPYQFNRFSSLAGDKNIRGIGDITVMANYNLWERMTRTQGHTLTGGFGVKLPTGKYTSPATTDKDQQDFQVGTGSIDYLVNVVYRFSAKNWVFAGSTTYKYNTQNKDDYRYGDTWTNGLTAIYKSDFNKISLLPNISIVGEHYMSDANKHVLQDHSGGDIFFAGAGLDVNTRKIAVGVNYQMPLSQNMSKGAMDVKSRLSAHLTFIL